MKETKTRLNPPGKPGLKMKELVEASGVPKSTILHYVSLGLLPRPVKTSPNMAYYEPGCVDRIRLIRTMQNRNRLSLVEIKRLFTDSGGDPVLAAMTLLNRTIFSRTSGPLLTEVEYCRATGLDRDQLTALKKAELLLPLDADGYDQEDTAAGAMLAKALESGLEIEDMAYYPRLGREMVEREMALRSRRTGRLPPAEDAAVTVEMTQGARLLRSYVIDRLFQLRVASYKNLKQEDNER